MLDDLLEDVVGVWVSSKFTSKRTEVIMRLFFGMMGTVLSLAGVYLTMGYDAGLAFRLAGAILFFFLACFCTFNIVLLKQWRWPGRYFLYSLVALFAVRIVFGA